MEARLTSGVGGVRIGAEVVVEGHVLLEDHDQVLDRRGGPRRDREAAPRARPAGARRAGDVRRRVRARRRGTDGDAGPQGDGAGDGGVVPRFLMPDTDHGWAFAHVRPPESAGGRPGGPLRTPGHGAGAPTRIQKQNLTQRDNTVAHLI